MGRYRGPKHKLSRREGVDLFGTGGESLERRLTQPPGEHGRRPRRRESEYGIRLREKQKVKRMYGMREKQFLEFYRKAQKSPGPTGTALLQLLERRLDNVVYRLGYAKTRPQARQMVLHGHVIVDGKSVDIPSYIVSPGQVVTLDRKAFEMPDVKALTENPVPVPAWLERIDGVGQVLREPERSEMDKDINEQFIVEFYSR
ncbi:MAG TPA: 30S ribosomal protein S4 [Deltaproteobacteria bacterium]|jgi:small subunit ribosomal protein S4|nr:30S ribosomal protein S4 [Deltaproteobacteria bacterium]HQI02346.1 30S ribosomal protein S4 [Deltaproteobacteria bacterium]HQJ09197.1 30S ribosomal protein S4 [Deltaproteobacteria bacterium]